MTGVSFHLPCLSHMTNLSLHMSYLCVHLILSTTQPSIMECPAIPAFGKWKQEDKEFKISLSHIVHGQPGLRETLFHKTKTKKLVSLCGGGQEIGLPTANAVAHYLKISLFHSVKQGRRSLSKF